MAKTISRSGAYSGAATHTDMLRALAQQAARKEVAGSSALTNNSGGAVSSVRAIAAVALFAATAVSGSNLASKATAETALGTVKNAISVTFEKANALATALGIATITDSSGGTIATSGTIAAVTLTTTGASTGAAVAESNAVRASINAAVYNLAVLTNRIAEAVGEATLAIGPFGDAHPLAEIPAMSVVVGTAVAPGVSKADMDAALVTWAADIATIATRLNAVVVAKKPLILAVL